MINLAKLLKGKELGVKKGNKVTTKFGEKLEILDVQKLPVKRQGVSTGEVETRFLAESGGVNCWFPVNKYLKEDNK